jgi:hypothetical protein
MAGILYQADRFWERQDAPAAMQSQKKFSQERFG